ncbi:helix-turn-helix domain-containing protein [Flavobacterium sp.]|uniref:helix-turn-helix domain-containing protein n=1 Tax=Flavobacterium sp. TaxID=239 RepID=UPI00286E864D|nr:helix-turn-helix domain-containing protein [Flavobacterium sp.]
MNSSREILFFFSLLGVFNGLILGSYLIFINKGKHLSNYFLGLLLFALSIRIGKSVFFYFNHGLSKIYLQIGLSACFFIGPLLFFFTKSIVEKRKTTPNNWKLHLTLLFIVIAIIGIVVPYITYPELWGSHIIPFIYTIWFLYILASGIIIKDIIKRKLIKTSDGIQPNENWLLLVYFSNVLIFLFYAMSILTIYFIYINGAILFSLLLYISILAFFFRNKTDSLFSLTTIKYVNKKVNDADANFLIEKIKKIMNEKKRYQNPNLSLNEFATEVNISSHQLSQLLNDNLGKNFTTFVNEYRINEACNLILTNDKFTLEGVGYEVGFSSKSTFFSAFKKIKGSTPLNFQQNNKE